MRHSLATACVVLPLLALVAPAMADTPLTTTRVASGLVLPLFVCSPPGDLQRLFIVEQGGKIKIVKNGALLPTPFLDITTQVVSGGELGLLGLAFHPDYVHNGRFFVYYTRASDGADTLSRCTVTANPDVADPSSLSELFAIADPYSNHNGARLAFGPADGYLYLGIGDGGSHDDPGNRAQDPSTLLGKMLRIDVDHGNPYSSPPTNPFFGPGDPLDEIWALGMRNPWRWSFDRATGDMYIADVGQSSREEIDFQPAASHGGENYGWRCMEGTLCTGSTGCTCGDPALTEPIWEISSNANCAVIGGYVYRGSAVPDLQGTYFYGAYCEATISTFRFDGTTVTDPRDRTAELAPGGGLDIQTISSFGEDGWGELYICDLSGGEVFKIVPRDPVASWSRYGQGWPGTLGVPDLALDGNPKLCTAIHLLIGNSLGAPTLGLLMIGSSSASKPTPFGGTLLVLPSFYISVTLPAAGARLPVKVPCDPLLSGLTSYLQTLEVDSAATQDVSFTNGVEMTLGP